MPKDMQGKPLRKVIEEDKSIREYSLFGIHGAHVNIFDGQYIYMKSPVSEANKPLYEYTLIPTHMRNLFSPAELSKSTLVPGDTFSFTKNCPVLKIEKGNGNGSRDFSDILINGKDSEDAKHIDNNSMVNSVNFGDKLFDMRSDPLQTSDIKDPSLEAAMANKLVSAMKDNDCPEEQFERIGLPADRVVTVEDILKQRAAMEQTPEILPDLEWTRGGINTYRALLKFIPKAKHAQAAVKLTEVIPEFVESEKITTSTVLKAVPKVIDPEYVTMVQYFIGLSGRTE